MRQTGAKIAEDVQKYGWHMITVPADEQGPGFTYSIGFFKSFGHPEVIVFGLSTDLMQHIVQKVAILVKAGSRFSDGGRTGELLDGYDCAFREVHRSQYANHLGYAMWFNRTVDLEEFPALQCFWPDRDGRFPWDPSCASGTLSLQPALYGPLV